MSPRSSIYSFGERYDQTYFGFKGDTSFYKNKCKNVEKVLYLGVGTGRIFSKIYSQNKKIIGLDISKKMLNKLREKFPQINPENLVVADVKEFNFPKNNFDLIIAPYAFFNFFSYEENKRLFNNIFGSLKKGGEITTDFLTPFLNPHFSKSKEIIKNGRNKTIIEYNFINQEFTETNKYRNEEFETKLHNYFFYPKEIIRLFEDAGFDQIRISGDYKHNKLSTKSKLILVESKKL